jgi:thiol-disulfide isomerase/thioredoxin
VTLLNNKSYTLPKNEPIIIYFWGTWCPVCKMQSKNIETVSKNFNVLSIAVKSGSNMEIEEYLKSQNLSFSVFNDQDSSMAQKFRISIFPTIIIFDKDGNEIFSDVGYTTIFGLWLRMWWATL